MKIPFNFIRTSDSIGNGRAVYFTSNMYYLHIPTLGSSGSFGNLTYNNRDGATALSNSSRGICLGGSANNLIEYITLAILGNASNFGNMKTTGYATESSSNSVRGIYNTTSVDAQTKELQYVNIASLGNSKSFGALTSSTRINACSAANSTRSFFMGGGSDIFSSADVSSLEYVDIASFGYGVNFGTLTSTLRIDLACVGSTVRGVIAGGRNVGNELNGLSLIDYFSYPSLTSTSSFGTLTQTQYYFSGTSNAIRGVFGRGSESSVNQYVTIATTGNSANFASIGAGPTKGACSDSHGGL